MSESKGTTKKGTAKKIAQKGARSRRSKSTGTGITPYKEIKGLVICAFALIAFLGLCHVNVGIFGEFFSYIFIYGFGIGAIVPIVFVFYKGLRLIYSGSFGSITGRGLLLCLFFVLLLTFIPLVSVPDGSEMSTQFLADYGGVIGGALASGSRALLGHIGAIILNVVCIIACALLIFRLSLSKGLHKAKDTTQVGINKAREVAAEQAMVMKERYEEWKEERKEERKAYDRERDTSYQDVVVDAEPVASSPEAVVHADRGEELNPYTRYRTVPTEQEGTNDYSEDTDYNDEMDWADDWETPPADDDWVEPTPIDDETPFVRPSVMQHPVEPQVVEVSEPTPVVTTDNATVDIIDSPSTGTATNPNVATTPSVTPPPVLPLHNVGSISTQEDTAQVAVSKEGDVQRSLAHRSYRFPSLELLAKGKETIDNHEEVVRNTHILETTLHNFKINAKVVNATKGPAVTRYEIEPAPGTKVSKIVGLTDDLKLALAAADIRMEAPIPGKAAIGIEVPNSSVSPVHLRDVLECDDFKEARGGIPVGLGKDIAGKSIITDLSKMPHLLVAGSTGSGKSVCINTLISSILFSRKPDEVKLILIDPKVVELATYNGIPHLMAPVVTDMKKAAATLRWAVREMEARYRTFAATGVRDVKRYNELHPDKRMPLILIIIDELADLMMTAPADIEESIARLGQKARASGIHMVLATQRPSVDVINGTIKSNVPSRISFAVASQVDSRTILDVAGAEKLLGKGDMLFQPIGANKPVRIQGAFVSDDEVEQLVDFVKKQAAPEYDESVTEAVEEEEKHEDDDKDIYEDEYLEKAIDLVLDQGQASTSFIQRKLRVGYTRASRLVDTMEEMKIIGPSNGSKARDILMTRQQVKEAYFPNSTLLD